MTSPGVGEAAALLTAVLWSACAQLFGAAGLRIGSVAVNHVRLLAALVIVPLLHWAVVGTLLPQGLGARAAVLLVLSGLVGIVLGDSFGFRALVLVGPRVTTLISTTTPALATLLAFAFLGEALGAQAVAGMAVTVAGVGLASWRRTRDLPSLPLEPEGAGRARAIGIACALGGALGQAGGMVLAKPALATCSALTGTEVRVVAACVALWLATACRALVLRKAPTWWTRARSDRRALALTLGGTVTGPALGVWASLVAAQRAPIAVATTLMSLVPLFVLAEDWAFRGRRPLWAEGAGAVLAVVGIAILVTA